MNLRKSITFVILAGLLIAPYQTVTAGGVSDAAVKTSAQVAKGWIESYPQAAVVIGCAGTLFATLCSLYVHKIHQVTKQDKLRILTLVQAKLNAITSGVTQSQLVSRNNGAATQSQQTTQAIVFTDINSINAQLTTLAARVRSTTINNYVTQAVNATDAHTISEIYTELGNYMLSWFW